MLPLTFLALIITATFQADRRPILTVTSDHASSVIVRAEWAAMRDLGGNEFVRHEWEARDAATLLGTGIVESTQASFEVARPSAADTLEIRVFVRGIGVHPGPWGWASAPLIVSGAAGGQPENLTAATAAGDLPDSSVTISLTLPAQVLIFPSDLPIRLEFSAPEPDHVSSPDANLVAIDDIAPPQTDPVPGPGPPAEPPSASEIDPDDPASQPVRVPRDRAPSGGPNQPPEFVELVRLDLTAAMLAADNVQLVMDEAAPLSPPGVYAIEYEQNLESGSAPVTIEMINPDMADITKLYVRYALKLDRQFDGHPSASNQVLTFSFGGNTFYDLVSGAGLSSIQYQVGLRGQRPACQLAKPAPRAQRLVPNHGSSLFLRDRWYTVELLIRPGTAGRCDGEVLAWMDGQLIMSYRDVGLGRTGSDPFTLDRVTFHNQWGTTGAPLKRAFTVWIDEIYLSGSSLPRGQNR